MSSVISTWLISDAWHSTGVHQPNSAEELDLDFEAEGFRDGLDTVLDGIQARIVRKST